MKFSTTVPVGATVSLADSKSTSFHPPSTPLRAAPSAPLRDRVAYCTFPVTGSLRASIPRVLAREMKNMSLERGSAVLERQTPSGDMAILQAFGYSVSLMLSLTHLISVEGSFSADFSSSVRTLLKNPLYGVRNSFSTLGQRMEPSAR